MNHVDIPTSPTVLSLCAGIGGLDLGIGLAFPGARTIGFVEREAACCEILASRMEEGWLDPAPIWTDVKTFNGRPWRGAVDILCSGYPCQPFSAAGRRQGDKDPRHLWPDIKRIIGECGRPTHVVLENVQGHVSKGLREVLKDLMELGYRCEWGVYSAAQAGASHRRNRVFILAHTSGTGPQGDHPGSREGRGETSERPPVGAKRSDLPLAHAIGPGERGGGELADSELQPAERCGVPRVVPKEAGEVESQVPQLDAPGGQGEDLADPFPPGPEGDWSGIPEELWPAVESSVRGVVDGVSVRVDQLRALGNAVVPQQAALAIRDLWERMSTTNPVT